MQAASAVTREGGLLWVRKSTGSVTRMVFGVALQD